MPIGPLGLITLLVLAIGLALAVLYGQAGPIIGAVGGMALLVISFLSTPLSLYLLVYSMLLGPEFVAGGMGGVSATQGRGVTLRFDDFLLAIIGFVWLVKSAIHKEESPVKYTPLNGPMMFYVAVCLFATLIGVVVGRVKPQTGFFFNLKYFEYFFVYFMVVNAVNTEQEVRGLVKASLITCFLVSLFGIAQIPTGIGTVDDVVRALDAGADKVSLNTAIVLRPEFLAEASKAVGSQSIVAAIDAKRENASPTTVWRASPTAVWRGSWRVWIKGGTEQTALDVIAWAKETVARGAGELLITSMDSDGTKKGYDLQLLKTVAEQVSVPLIASGGAGTKEHIKEAIIEGKADAVLAASIFHYQEISLYDIKRYLREHNIPVRL
ncbi:imidazole glycerol phosphate synthase cyclase subunit [Candidatus Azambacteria bacterium]|nr:imidazole glycerol phosphate synthase cyclase subunit [Candidatus Azambacteria bacterium]